MNFKYNYTHQFIIDTLFCSRPHNCNQHAQMYPFTAPKPAYLKQGEKDHKQVNAGIICYKDIAMTVGLGYMFRIGPFSKNKSTILESPIVVSFYLCYVVLKWVQQQK